MDYINAKQRPPDENPKILFLLSLLPDLNEMNTTQFRKFRSQVNGLIDNILNNTVQDSNLYNSTSLCSTPVESWVSDSISRLDYESWKQSSSCETTSNLTNIEFSNAIHQDTSALNDLYYDHQNKLNIHF